MPDVTPDGPATSPGFTFAAGLLVGFALGMAAGWLWVLGAGR